MASKITRLIITCLIISLFFGVVRASSIQIDRVGIVTTVYDGDTFVIDNSDSIRFADINTPEVGEVGCEEAKQYVVNLVEGETVYLDIDDVSRTDQYGRLVGVVYFENNATHYENLNKALLIANLADVYDFSNNEFSPSNWTLYLPKTQIAIPEFPTIEVIAMIIFSMTLFLVKIKSKWK
jgi:hypothetical protein